jgi:ubiquinone/menaquinone biosynthesis C-methylase UbiE
MKPRKRIERAQPKGPPHRPSVAGPRTDWGGVADWYDQLVGESGSEYHQQVVLPGVARLLALQPGDTAIDIACGQGVLCRVLRERGVQMTGVDAAGELIRVAKQRSEVPDAAPAPHERPPIRYLVGDARELSFLPGDYYASAACVLAIQNMHPLAPVFAGVARLLRPGGRFVMVLMHPCFRGPRETSWGWDEAARVQYRRVDRYLIPRKTPIVTHPGKSPDVYTWTFHKPIEAYVKALRGAGLLIDAMEEWPSHKVSTSGPRAPAENTARKEIPMFMAIRAVKVQGLAPPATGGETEEGDG